MRFIDKVIGIKEKPLEPQLNYLIFQDFPFDAVFNVIVLEDIDEFMKVLVVNSENITKIPDIFEEPFYMRKSHPVFTRFDFNIEDFEHFNRNSSYYMRFIIKENPPSMPKMRKRLHLDAIWWSSHDKERVANNYHI